MYPNRRELVDIASALGGSDREPPMANRIAAAVQLDQPQSTNPVLDPGAFAADVSDRLATRDDWGAVINPTQHAAYRQAQHAFEQMVPWHSNQPLWNAYNALISEMFNFAMVSYETGVRHGAAYEHLRQSVVGELRQCSTCRGVGVIPAGETCPECQGTGTVAFKETQP